jgi:hypothetical protein
MELKIYIGYAVSYTYANGGNTCTVLVQLHFSVFTGNHPWIRSARYPFHSSSQLSRTSPLNTNTNKQNVSSFLLVPPPMTPSTHCARNFDRRYITPPNYCNDKRLSIARNVIRKKTWRRTVSYTLCKSWLIPFCSVIWGSDGVEARGLLDCDAVCVTNFRTKDGGRSSEKMDSIYM